MKRGLEAVANLSSVLPASSHCGVRLKLGSFAAGAMGMRKHGGRDKASKQ